MLLFWLCDSPDLCSWRLEVRLLCGFTLVSYKTILWPIVSATKSTILVLVADIGEIVFSDFSAKNWSLSLLHYLHHSGPKYDCQESNRSFDDDCGVNLLINEEDLFLIFRHILPSSSFELTKNMQQLSRDDNTEGRWWHVSTHQCSLMDDNKGFSYTIHMNFGSVRFVSPDDSQSK